jgi:hypothetical protein
VFKRFSDRYEVRKEKNDIEIEISYIILEVSDIEIEIS